MRTATLAVALLAAGLFASSPVQAQWFDQTNLVSDVAGQALRTDPNLVNPWGLVPGGSGVFWSANEATGTSTLYNPDGTIRPLVVTIPGGHPTGIVATAPADSSFRIASGDSTARAAFLFVTLGGTVAAWSPNVNPTAAITVATTPGAAYTGAALGGTVAEPRLYAANFAAGRIDVFNRDFVLTTLAGTFTDPNLPSGYSPFNVANIGGQLFVVYAKLDTASGEGTIGAGLGRVSVFDVNGNYLRNFTSGGPLNAPWAVVQAPAGFGHFGGSVLIGDFGDGRIHAFDLVSGALQGSLRDSLGAPLSIEGLWGLHFGLGVSGPGIADRLYFAAGFDHETHGLFGYLAETDTIGGGGGAHCEDESRGIGYWRHLCGGPLHPRGGPGNGGGPGIGNGPGNGNGNGNGNGHGNGKGPGNGRGNGPRSLVGADSLDALLACVTGRAEPNAFGALACFTSPCSLLQQVGQRTVREKAAQQLLIVRLNLCAGWVCDSLALHCAGADPRLGLGTLGNVADSLEVLLCNGGSDAQLRKLTQLLACSGMEDDDKGVGTKGDGKADRGLKPQRLTVKTISASPVRLSAGPIQFSLTATEPTVAQLRVYDALGRLIAQPLQSSMVIGTRSVQWNGLDTDGHAVTPGTYFYRAMGGSATANGRIVIIR